VSDGNDHRRPRAVFFDAGNTLLRMDYAAIARELRRHGARVSAAALQRAEWRARVRLDDEVLGATAVSTESRATGDRYLQLLLEEIGVTDVATVRAVEAWRRDYNPPVGVWGRADPQAAAALTAVRDAGLVAGVISNSNGSARAILEALGLTAYLHFVLDSFEEGVEKPDPRLFRIGLERAGVRADEAAYVGDLYSVDVLGARAAGIEAVLLDPGRCWGARDCRTARDVLAAVQLLLRA
jgi:putative hydrolase of the HAD superfamily